MQVTHRDCGNTIGKEKERMRREREISILQRSQNQQERRLLAPPLVPELFI